MATTPELLLDEAKFFNSYFNVIIPEFNHAKNINEWNHVIIEILNKENINKLIVKGGSFGGIQAQAFHYQHSNLVDKLILVNTIPPQNNIVLSIKFSLYILHILPESLLKLLILKKLKRLFLISNITKNQQREVDKAYKLFKFIFKKPNSKISFAREFSFCKRFQ